jgi:8-oxo-dGTP pyrophosphatase MutT (NUDIX family)/diadenosine tetraphosphate (Ap4A) HIT family hydrolase
MMLECERCALCDRIRARKTDNFYLGCYSETHVFESPFAKQWPGALMLVYERHREEISDIVSNGIPPAQNALLVAEMAIRKIVNPARMNVVKFGNVCSHLHWHLIPRFVGELHATKTPWELQGLTDSELFTQQALEQVGALRAAPLALALKNGMEHIERNAARFFYAAAMVFRPRDASLREQYFEKSASEIVNEVRGGSCDFESLLMQRNYDDHGWDHFGGCADPAEFPADTLKREVLEEAGWRVRDYSEPLRHWRGRLLRGFSFVVMPESCDVYCKNLHPRVRGEAAKAVWVSLSEILDSPHYGHVIKLRTQSLLSGCADFDENREGTVIV